MKNELEPQEIEAIAKRVAEILRPIIARNGKSAEDMIFDVASLASYLQVDESWVYKQVSLKTIPHFKAGKYIRFKKSIIDKWSDEHSIRAVPGGPLTGNQLFQGKKS
ncbi:MAG: helix-turn-helix domain-containing protein [Nitrospiraceae bacterium]|nr:helix-turn-helix domain-containing protein [Nitrospiraceae bacterium]